MVKVKCGLCPRIQQRIKEIFDGKICCKCGDSAERLISGKSKKDDLFFCNDCMTAKYTHTGIEPFVLTEKKVRWTGDKRKDY
jgi:hypothetical protein